MPTLSFNVDIKIQLFYCISWYHKIGFTLSHVSFASYWLKSPLNMMEFKMIAFWEIRLIIVNQWLSNDGKLGLIDLAGNWDLQVKCHTEFSLCFSNGRIFAQLLFPDAFELSDWVSLILPQDGCGVVAMTQLRSHNNLFLDLNTSVPLTDWC